MSLSLPSSEPQPGSTKTTETLDRLRQALREQQLVFDSAGVGIAFIKNRTIERCNLRFAEIFGLKTPDELVGKTSQSLYPGEASFRALGKAAYPLLAAGMAYKTELLMKRVSGETFWAHLTGKLVTPELPDDGSIWIIDDINDEVIAQKSLQTALTEQNLVLDNAMVGIVFLRDRKVTQCNQSFERLFGYERGELIGKSSRQWYCSDEDWQAAGQLCYEPFSKGMAYEGEMRLCKKDGTPLFCAVRAKAIDANDLEQGSIWITDDISTRKQIEAELLQTRTDLERLVEQRTLELKNTVHALEIKAAQQIEAEKHITQLAHFDALTGLPNRLLLSDRCQVALKAAHRGQSSVGLIFLDLDHFKAINDSLGHRVGDAVLVELGVRLRSAVREKDTISRMGGDEFIILMPDTNAAGAARVAEKLLALAQAPMLLDHHELTITPSIGIAMYPKDGADLDSLARCADAAMYRAKADGRNNYHFYSNEIQGISDRRLVLSNALRRALERDQLSLRYQPQISVATGDIVGVEALLRWHHPELGHVSPAEFIPVAENNGLILPIGAWVIRNAIQQLADWIRRGMAPMTIAVNLSAVQFRHAELPELVTQALREANLPAYLFELELTEGAAMTNPVAAIAVMDDLVRRGIRLSIDDFGTGYSSLSYLKRFQVYKLKIDQTFVRDITVDPDDKAIVGAIISMASSLGIETIAEGVETEGQLAFLRDRGCTEVQGYLFSKPMTAVAFEAYIIEAASSPTLPGAFESGRVAPKRESVATAMAPLL